MVKKKSFELSSDLSPLLAINLAIIWEVLNSFFREETRSSGGSLIFQRMILNPEEDSKFRKYNHKL